MKESSQRRGLGVLNELKATNPVLEVLFCADGGGGVRSQWNVLLIWAVQIQPVHFDGERWHIGEEEIEDYLSERYIMTRNLTGKKLDDAIAKSIDRYLGRKAICVYLGHEDQIIESEEQNERNNA